MNFISTEYIVFLLITFVTTAFLRFRLIPYAILIASLFFYAWPNPFNLLLLGAIIAISYAGSLILERKPSLIILWVFILADLSFLLYYKYYAIVLDHLNHLSIEFGWKPQLHIPKIGLPIGISFFTFQAIGYLIDVYRREVPAEKSILDVALFLSFFPIHLAGPIERWSQLVPQLKAWKSEGIGRADLERGVILILKGCFIKFVVADNLAIYVDEVYANLSSAAPVHCILACYFFSIQIYADFYGYTLVALGTAALLGVNLTNNFDHPYLATNIQDFWRRWHISLSRWFRDYVYIPLGGNRVGLSRYAFNLIITMFLVGLWHGATIPYLIWGAMHGGLLTLHRIYRYGMERYCPVDHGWLRAIGRPLGWLATFHLVTLSWIFFRSGTYDTAKLMLVRIYDGLGSLSSVPLEGSRLLFALRLSAIFVLFEIGDYWLDSVTLFRKAPAIVQAACIVLFLVAMYLGPFSNVQFIYFQF